MTGGWPADDERRTRRVFQRIMAYAIPSPEAIALVTSYSPLVECGAGSGYWAKLLSDAGADIIAFDQEEVVYRQCKGGWFPVELCGLGGLRHLEGRTPLLCWPPDDTDFAYQVASRVSPGQFLIHIGEDEPFDYPEFVYFLDLLRSSFVKLDELAIPCWYGRHDRLTVYKRA
jgi:hypothetical protein